MTRKQKKALQEKLQQPQPFTTPAKGITSAAVPATHIKQHEAVPIYKKTQLAGSRAF